MAGGRNLSWQSARARTDKSVLVATIRMASRAAATDRRAEMKTVAAHRSSLGPQDRKSAHLYPRGNFFRSFSIRPAGVKRDPVRHNHARLAIRRGPSHSFVRSRSFLRPGLAQNRCCSAQLAVKAGALAPPRGLGLDGREHGCMLDAAWTAEVFRCRSQGLASLRDGHGGPPSMG
jgi:hypothetical protein